MDDPPPPPPPPHALAASWSPPARHDQGYVAATVGGAVGLLMLATPVGIAMFWVVPAAVPTDGPGLGVGGVFFLMVVTGLAGLVGLGVGTAIGLRLRGHPFALSTAAIAVGLAAAFLMLPVVGVVGWMAAPALARLIRTRAGSPTAEPAATTTSRTTS